MMWRNRDRLITTVLDLVTMDFVQSLISVLVKQSNVPHDFDRNMSRGVPKSKSETECNVTQEFSEISIRIPISEIVVQKSPNFR
jgi:hypothetical protein